MELDLENARARMLELEEVVAKEYALRREEFHQQSVCQKCIDSARQADEAERKAEDREQVSGCNCVSG